MSAYRLNFFSTVAAVLDEIPQSADVIEVTQASYERMVAANCVDVILTTPPVSTFLGRKLKIVTGPTVQFQRLPHGTGLPLPKYQTADAAGMDLTAAVTNDVVILPGTRKAIPCGFNVAIPFGYEGQCRPRSGLACKFGITLANSPGTIDADYRGEIICFLVNHGDTLFTVKRGDRIAQMIVTPVAQAEVREVPTLTETNRGAGGFGSTGR